VTPDTDSGASAPVRLPPTPLRVTLCVTCRQPTRDGRLLCDPHRVDALEHQVARIKALLEDGHLRLAFTVDPGA